MTDLSIVSRFDGPGIDTRWRRSHDVQNVPLPGTLDLTKFVAGTHYNLGNTFNVIPSGVAVGLITATGLYGPFDTAAADGRQTLAGFINDDQGIPLYREVGVAVSTKALFARLVVGVIKSSLLPIAAQRTTVKAAALTNSVDFTYVED